LAFAPILLNLRNAEKTVPAIAKPGYY